MTENDTLVADKYARLACEYDNRWSFYITATTQKTLQRLKPVSGDIKLLDVGCGTGVLLQAISVIYPSIELIGADLSFKMLKITEQKLGPKARLIVCNSCNLPFPDEQFDIVVSCSSLHYWRNPLEALKEISRVLKPLGEIIITDWCSDYLSCRILDIFLRIFERTHYRIYGSKECAQMLETSIGRSVSVERYKLNRFWGLMTLKA